MSASGDDVVLRVPAGLLVLSLIVLGACAVAPAAVVVGAVGPGGPLAVGLLVAVAAAAGWFLVRPVLGSRTAVIGPDGIRFRAFLWDRRKLLLSWDDIAHAWLQHNGVYTFLCLLPQDPRSFITGSPIRRTMLSSTLEQFGAPFTVYVPGGDASAASVRSAVSRFSVGALLVADQPPPHRLAAGPVAAKRPVAPTDPAAIEPRLYRTPPRSWLLPAALIAVAVPVSVVGVWTDLLTVWMVAALVGVPGGVSVWWRGGRTRLDDSGFTVGERHVPWSRITAVRVESIDRWHLVKLDVGGSETVIARGLADHPPGDPTFAAKLADVQAACAGRVPFERTRRSVLPNAVGVAVISVAAIAYSALAVDHLRHQAWWPGVEIAVDTPDPCQILGTAAAHRLVPASGRPQPVTDPPAEPVTGPVTSSGSAGVRRQCRLDGERDRLDVGVERYGPGRVHPVTAADRALRSYAGASGLAETIPGLGDTGVGGVRPSGTVLVAARRANVVVTVSYTPGVAGTRDPGADWTDIVAIAESSLAAARVR